MLLSALKLSILLVCLIILVLASIQDIKHRKVGNFILVLLLLFSLSFFLFEKVYLRSLLLSVIVLFIGMILAKLNLLGGADSKLIAILILAVSPNYFVLFVFFLICLMMATIIIYGLGFFLGKAQRSRGIPLIPAISLAGWMCVWLTAMDAHGLVS